MAVRLTSTIRSNASGSALCAGPSPRPPMPTTLTSTSIRPRSARTRATVPAHCSSCVMSAVTAVAEPPSPRIDAAVSSARSAMRSTQNTSAPSRAKIVRDRPAVADRLARGLAGADDEGDESTETSLSHEASVPNGPPGVPRTLRAPMDPRCRRQLVRAPGRGDRLAGTRGRGMHGLIGDSPAVVTMRNCFLGQPDGSNVRT